jgi:hypothetical protein
MTMTQAIKVPRSPWREQFWTAVRQIVPPVITFAVGRGWLANDTAVMLGAVALGLWPIIYGQQRTLERSRQLAIAAEAAPDHVAVVK